MTTTRRTVLSIRCEHQEEAKKAVNRHVHRKAPDSGSKLPRARSGLEEENKNRMPLLQQVMCQRFARATAQKILPIDDLQQ
jgi:hypothetical protein